MSLAHSRALIDAYNRRDAAAIRALVADDVSYVRPGPRELTTVDDVIALYQLDFDKLHASRVDVRAAWEHGDEVSAEITVTVQRAEGDEPTTFQGAVFHRWRDGKLVRYRAYFDTPPAARR